MLWPILKLCKPVCSLRLKPWAVAILAFTAGLNGKSNGSHSMQEPRRVLSVFYSFTQLRPALQSTLFLAVQEHSAGPFLFCFTCLTLTGMHASDSCKAISYYAVSASAYHS